MSYIVPRNKPDRCTNCPFMDRITYDCMLMYEDYYSDFEEQYNNCPLVDIPTPHGRLIDADKLKSRLVLDNDSNELQRISADILKWIDIQETVIEAEGSET